jgi:NCS1 family nucleobase:cation symporter-1
VPAAAIAVALAFVPVLEPFAPFSWPVGAALGAVFTVVAAPRGATYRAVSGESIAVTPSAH